MRALISLTAAIALMGCGGSGYSSGVTSPPDPVQTTSVSLRNDAFSPRAIKVTSGATVTFTNNDGRAHNVIFSSSAIVGAADFAAGTKSVEMPVTPGTYAYHCTIPPGMTGSVVVE
jgi:plastocyanin